MPVLTDNERQQVDNAIERFIRSDMEDFGTSSDRVWASLIDSPEIRAAVNAADTWINDNQASFKTALPVNFRTNATPLQMTLLFCIIALARVDISFLKKIFGKVD